MKKRPEPSIVIRNIHEKKSDFEYWQPRSPQERLAVLEEIRREYHQWRYGAEPEFKEFIQSLNAKKVRYLVVGGYAVAMHGYPRYTKAWISGLRLLSKMPPRTHIEPDTLGMSSPIFYCHSPFGDDVRATVFSVACQSLCGIPRKV